jgi:hypothetical protein
MHKPMYASNCRTKEMMNGIKRHLLFLLDPTTLRIGDIIENTYHIKIQIPIPSFVSSTIPFIFGTINVT